MGIIDGFKWLIVPTGVDLNASSVSIKIWTTYKLTATFTPSNPTNNKIYWSSSNTSIATVDSNWLVTPVSPGSCTITATTDYGNYTDTCSFTITVVHTTGVSLDEHSIELEAWNTIQLTATVTPSDTSYPEVTWYSTNTSVATVSNSWLVTYVWDGECTITVTTIDWWYTDSCSVSAYSFQWFYSDKNYNEYIQLVWDTWSIQFVDTWKRFRFNYAVYIWNRTAIDFNWSTMRTINLDTLTVTSSKSSSITWRVWYIWNNRILTKNWIIDFDWNTITSFSYNSVTPGDNWIIWANSWYDIYKWILNWDSVTFTKIWTSWTDQWAWEMNYWYLWAYLLNGNDTSWSWLSAYVNPSTNQITNFWWESNSRQRMWFVMPDWKMYRLAIRNNWWWRMQKIWTTWEWLVWNSLSTSWLAYWSRWWKFLWNIVSWWMNSNNWQWNWYWSNNYFINTNWNLSLVQSNAFAYDTNIYTNYWFIDENWWIYPMTSWWGSWVIFKTNKTFTNLNWKNPYLYR